MGTRFVVGAPVNNTGGSVGKKVQFEYLSTYL